MRLIRYACAIVIGSCVLGQGAWAAPEQGQEAAAGPTTAGSLPAATPQSAIPPPGDAKAAEPVAPAAVPVPPKPIPVTLVAKIDLTTQSMTVAENGRQLFAWKISSGRDGYPTPKGSFRAQWVAKMWYSRQYDMAPMPFAVFFKDGAAIHGTSAVGQLGRPASHGCVRLTNDNAQTFFKLVNKHGLAATKIIVQGNPPAAQVARYRDDRRRSRDEDRYAGGYGYRTEYGTAPRERMPRAESDGFWPWGGYGPRYRDSRY